MPELSNPKRERFCQEYLIDLNATKAAVRAGYGKATARQIGSRLLSKVDIAARIGELQKARSERTQITQDMVLQEIAAIAFGSIGKVITWSANEIRIKPFSEADPQAWHGVALLRCKPGEIHVAMQGKIAALDMLARHLGLYDAPRHRHNEADYKPPPGVRLVRVDTGAPEEVRKKYERK